MPDEQKTIDPRVGSVFIATIVHGKGNSSAIHFINACALADKSAGARLSVIRKMQGLSRGELADRAGLHVEKIRLAETCPRDVPIGILAKICDTLKCSFGDVTEELLVKH